MAPYDLNYGPDYAVVLVDEVAGHLGLGAADDVYPDLPTIFLNTWVGSVMFAKFS